MLLTAQLAPFRSLLLGGRFTTRLQRATKPNTLLLDLEMFLVKASVFLYVIISGLKEH